MNIGVLCEREGLAGKIAALGTADYIYSYEFPLCSGKGAQKWIQLMPHVFRKGTEIHIDSRADGVLIRNTDELGYILEQGLSKEIVADCGVYTMNAGAVRELMEDGVTRTTYPLELNFKELAERGYPESSELIVYGRAGLMISANCVYKDSRKKCAHTGGREDNPAAGRGQFYVNLKDRKNTDFPVLCDCRYCYNVIYNSVPTSLHKAMDRVCELNPHTLRLDFTDEDYKSAAAILEYYVNLIRDCQVPLLREGKRDKAAPGKAAPEILNSFTYGHFKNAVE
ncbi:MAG: hypothetical protein J6O71_03930 [Lachnospiraceae bacterium]|nr:hypothetical protein [Lachnospiraceae bacterium]